MIYRTLSFDTGRSPQSKVCLNHERARFHFSFGATDAYRETVFIHNIGAWKRLITE